MCAAEEPEELLHARYSSAFYVALLYLGLCYEDLMLPQSYYLEASEWVRQAAVALWRRRVGDVVLRVRYLEGKPVYKVIYTSNAGPVILNERRCLPSPDIYLHIKMRDELAQKRYDELANRMRMQEAARLQKEHETAHYAASYSSERLYAATSRRELISRTLQSAMDEMRDKYEFKQRKTYLARSEYYAQQQAKTTAKFYYMESKLVFMKYKKQSMDEQRRYDNEFARKQQEQVMEKVLYEIQHNQLEKQRRSREMLNERSARIDSYFERYYEELRIRDLQFQHYYAKHYAQKDEALAEKSQKAHYQTVKEMDKHYQLWSRIKAQSEQVTNAVIERQAQEAAKAEARRREILEHNQTKMREQLFKAYHGALKGYMLMYRENYTDRIGKARLDAKTERMLELKASTRHRREVMRKYTVTGENCYTEVPQDAFSLEQFLNFDHLEKGYIRGQQIKTMLDMAYFMEQSREEERYAILYQTESEYYRTVLRQEFCKERRNSSKILRILEGMWREEDQGIIV